MPKRKPLAREQLEGFGSLITIKGANTCLGDLWASGEHGTWDPNFGLVPVDAEEAEAHNKALDEARIKGLDEGCKVGQCGSFYFDRKAKQVRTFSGAVVEAAVRVAGETVTFERKGRVFRGRLRKHEDWFIFKRIS
jgi:hypothetical protein